ncbi:tRNA (uracil-5-)-methyltransferase homolog B-like isoform X1 [Monodelphis domestica]|uniref:tRNA (uracil-5-)-methyltransferase homolog B-like isoform X1 n=1 Tax=Monodelphis domestica TaxID=13616 RepID=UPI0024E1996E|nr:tRNA (uracil-5-)-methyltransferase homolog B-like isoform X1 [Monodelphis domestica]
MACPTSVLAPRALASRENLRLLPCARGPGVQLRAALASAGAEHFQRPAASEPRPGEGETRRPQVAPGQALGFWQERLADQLLPLWRLNYEEQLKVKFEVLKKSLEQLQSRLHSPGGASGEPRGLGALLQPFVPSPVIEGYRNKSVFSVNRGPDGHPQTVGCFLRSPGGKEIFCVPADRLRALPASHLQVAQCYEAFLRQTPAQPGLSPPGLGPWRRLRVRTGLQGHRMAIVTFHAQGLSQEAVRTHKERVRDFFTSGPGAACGLTSLYLKESAAPGPGLSGFPRYELVAGEPHVLEDVLGLRLRVSPGAFFPPNTGAAEAVCRLVAELSGADGSAAVLDLSRGTGATGLSLARRAAHVWSVQLAGQAVEDARWSSAFNGITNWECRRWDVDKAVAQIRKAEGDSLALVVLLDPAGAALSPRVLRAVRGCPAIRTLVFVSSRPHREDMDAFEQLCCPVPGGQDPQGEPFVLGRAVPVDAFPHTLSSQLLLAFTR